MCGRVRLANDYSEIKIRLKWVADNPSIGSLRAVYAGRG
jgi:hypothetical protein